MDKMEGNESFLYEVLYDGTQLGAIQAEQSLLFDLDGDGIEDQCTLNTVLNNDEITTVLTVETKSKHYEKTLYHQSRLYLISGELYLEKFEPVGGWSRWLLSIDEGEIVLNQVQDNL